MERLQKHKKMLKNSFKAQYENFYNQKAAPLIVEFNANRSNYRKTVLLQQMAFFFLCLFMIGFLFIGVSKFFEPEGTAEKIELAGISIFIIASIALSIILFFGKNYGDILKFNADGILKNKLMPEFVRIFGTFTWHHEGIVSSAKTFKFLRQSNIVPENITAVGDDYVEGSYEGVGIKISEIHIGYRSLFFMLCMMLLGPSVLFALFFVVTLPVILLIFVFNSVVFMILEAVLFVFALIYLVFRIIRYFFVSGRFKGVMIELDMPKSFSGHTFIYENALSAQALRNKNKIGYEKIHLEDVIFSKAYSIYSTNQIEARYILTPVFMERLKNIAFAFEARYLRMSFQNNKLVLLASTDKDLFLMGNAFKDSNKQTFDTLFDEVCSVLNLVDELKLRKLEKL